VNEKRTCIGCGRDSAGIHKQNAVWVAFLEDNQALCSLCREITQNVVTVAFNRIRMDGLEKSEKGTERGNRNSGG